MLQNDTCEYVVRLRREIHEYPEIGFDLPKTLAVVRRELDALGIPYTEEYGKSSIVGTINPDCDGFTIGLRGDMDALPIQEEVDLPFASKNPGIMHACGHDAHTAILLAAAKELKAREKELTCRVKLLFTPAEEYINPGCELMVKDGVMDDIDCAVALHVAPTTPVGAIRTLVGGKNANSTGFVIEFFGKNCHAADQQNGKDAIAMAVEAYTALEIMCAKEFKARDPRVFNVGAFNGGNTNNIICNYCKMFGSSRTHSDAVSQYMIDRIREICDSVAKCGGGSAKVEVVKYLPFVINHPVVTQKLRQSAARLLGEDKIGPRKDRTLGGEDFSFLCRKKPGMMIRLGTAGEDPHTQIANHSDGFDIDENCLKVGVDLFVQFVLDNMDGIEGL